ncbi:gag-protease polyprotein [Cucumis melo var. makuwa]|uniref:Gag-protease polyprotein n=1 Tax=Cucumis melo var. makuwa TaxID=1194695 RepID=A0A5D3DE37_CUCMM|nr:gag-protease polyprotein [Cucumis melo var. makuwa]TYK21852.1 gag-protease polyprotein [Cucumis melo var. makuwa]
MDKATRTEKFVRCVKLDLQGFIRAFRPTTHAVALRLTVDISLHEKANLSKTAEKGSTPGQKRKELAAVGKALKELPACCSCGRSDEGRCLVGSGVCFRCKQPGHTTDFYPQKLLETTSNQIPTS